MLVQRKALYNLIQLNLNRIESGELRLGDLKGWQIANYREKTNAELFHQLNGLGILIETTEFDAIGKISEDPEEIVAKVAPGRTPLEQDEIYLIVFELWRRFFPEKRTISIFCDELDHQMICYDLEKPNEMADSLVYLQQLLDEHVDRGMAPQQAFQMVQINCANDIESFLFDYILDVIDSDNQRHATELLDGFKRYVKFPIWFDYLEARATILTDPEEGYDHLEKVIEQVDATTHLDLVEEILFFCCQLWQPHPVLHPRQKNPEQTSNRG